MALTPGKVYHGLGRRDACYDESGQISVTPLPVMFGAP